MKPKSTLTKTDWIKAGFRALTREGPQAIKAEGIARSLKVSKGSFYWHFKDVAAFEQAMVGHWKQTATQAIIATLDRQNDRAQDRLAQLVDIISSGRNVAYGGPRAEAAIRDWARFYPALQQTIGEMDRQRLDYVAQLFGDCGFDVISADKKAKTLYAALIGLEQLSYLNRVNLRDDLRTLLYDLLGD